MTGALLLRVKAEVVMGLLLAVRSRTVRLVYVSAVTWISLSILGRVGNHAQEPQQTTVFLVSGSVAAVIGSRLLAPGGALSASRQVAARFWVVPSGRLIGGALLVLPVVAVAALSLRTVEVSAPRLLVAVAAFSTAVAAGVMALAPAMGRSAAAVIGFVAVWIGVVPPDDLHSVFETWPPVQSFLSLIWQLFPLQWRAGRLLDGFYLLDAAMFAAWIVTGVVLAGWYSTPVRISERRFCGSACR